VLDSDLSGCADDAVAAFFRDKPVRVRCSRLSRQLQDLLVVYPPTPVPPRSLSQLGTPRRLHGRAGRTVRAAELTFYDAILQILSASLSEDSPKRVERIGGLRAGRLIARTRPKVRLRLDRYSYVRGVAVSARLGNLSRSRLRLRVGGRHAAHGRLTFDLHRDRVTGRIGGRRVHLRFTADIGAAVGGLYELRSAPHRGALRRCCEAPGLPGSGL
jgi:hypothetical protein